MLKELFGSLETNTALVFLCVLLAIWLYQSTQVPKNFPPGPWPWPVIGNLGIFTGYPLQNQKSLTELSERYGKVVGLKLGSLYTVLINGLEATKEALVNNSQAFDGRPEMIFVFTQTNSLNGKRRGILWTDGHLWKESRRFLMRSLRDFGVGKRSLEERMQEEADAMCDELAKQTNKPYDLTTLSQEATSNIICSICFGSRFEYKSPEFQKLMNLIRANLSAPGIVSPLNFIPLVRYLPRPHWFLQVMENANHFHGFIEQQIELHRSTFDHNQLRDIIDLYLEKERKDLVEGEVFSRDNVIMMLTDLLIAGSETTSSSIRWFLLYMIHHPQIQGRCQAEIDRVIGSGRRPSLADRVDMPYLDATINEMQRLANVTNLSIPHSTTRDTKLFNYSIPKDTVVLVNLQSLHMDPDCWQNPEEFRPERWLGADGKVQKMESFMPFSTGSRVCLGESLAKSELLLFITTLLQRFTFSPEDPQRLPPLEGIFGFATTAPVTFRVVAKER